MRFTRPRTTYGSTVEDTVTIDTYPTPRRFGDTEVKSTFRISKARGYPYYTTSKFTQDMSGEQMLYMARMLHAAGIATIEAERTGNA